MEKAAFIDIFTTQNDLYGKNNCPIQFCCEFVSDSDMYDKEKLKEFMSPTTRKLFNIIPDEPISISGYITSGFKTEDTKTSDYNGHDLNTALNAIYKILTVIKEKDLFLIGYNHINYDLDILNKSFKRVLNLDPIVFSKNRIIDVMNLAEVVIPVDKVGNYSMDSVFVCLEKDYLKLSNLKLRKSTATDIKMTKIMMLKMLMSLGKKMSFSDIVEFIDNRKRSQNVFGFGKYKGLSFEDVYKIDIGYFSWIMGNKTFKETNPYLVESVSRMLNEIE